MNRFKKQTKGAKVISQEGNNPKYKLKSNNNLFLIM